MKKREKKSGSHGAVTVFLTLILVPCMIFTCAFGDVSRVRLSQAQAAAASDLALYSLMANYDEDLKEWYGMVASCNNVSEFYSQAANYFVGMMKANGIEGTDGDNLAAFFSKAVDAILSGDFSDFLQVEGLEGVKVEAVTDGGLGGNPALIEDSIVEFMKYRGPVVLVESLLERFNLFKSGTEEAEKNEPIVDAKKEYCEKTGKAMDEMLRSYLAMRVYVDERLKDEVRFPFIDQYPQYKEDLDNIYKDFEKVTDVITKYYAATSGIKNVSTSFPALQCPDSGRVTNRMSEVYSINLNDTLYKYTAEELGGERDEENQTWSFSESAINAITEKIPDHVSSIKKSADNILEAAKVISVPSDSNPDVNPAVYCMRMQNTLESKNSDFNNIKNHGKALMQILCKLYLVKCWILPEGNAPSGKLWGQEVQSKIDEIVQVHNNYLSWENPGTDYERCLSTYKGIAGTEVPKVKNRSYLMNDISFGGRSTIKLGDYLEAVSLWSGSLLEKANNQILALDRVLNGFPLQFKSVGMIVNGCPSLDRLKTTIKEFATSRDNWGAEANRGSTDYAKDEAKEYQNPDPEENANELKLKKLAENNCESVEILRKRLTNIRNDIVTLKEALEGFKYGDYPINLLINAGVGIDAAKAIIPNTTDPNSGSYISLSLTENSQKAKEYYSQLVKAPQYTVPAVVAGEAGNEPDLRKDSPEIFDYFDKEFGKDDKKLQEANSKKQEKETEQDNAKKQAEEEEKSAKGYAEKYVRGIGIDPVETSGGDSYNIGTALGGLWDVGGNIFSGNFDEIRDQLYVTTYAMEMFSWSSYNNEGQFKWALGETGKDDNKYGLKDLSDKGDYVKKGELDPGTQWKEEDLTFRNNKSLTNRIINATNNRSNLAEIEYLLYGKATNKENLDIAYGQLFGIRETLNLISGFVTFWSPGPQKATANAINGIADGVMAATAGLIPSVVTKGVLIAVIATMESAHDLNRLKAGLPVVVYKTSEDDWVYSFSGDNISSIFNSESRNTGWGRADLNGLYYSDYMLVFLFLSCCKDEMYPTVLKRIGDLVEGNVKLYNKDFNLEDSQCYFKLTGELRVKPLFLSLPIVTNYKGADASKVIEATDWCTYKLETIRGYS